MALSEETQQKFVGHIKKRMKSPPKCPICAGEEFSLEGPVSMPPAPGSSLPLPLIAMVCKSCHYTNLFFWNS